MHRYIKSDFDATLPSHCCSRKSDIPELVRAK